MGFAAILVTAAAVPVGIEAIEITDPHVDIWAHSWTYIGLSLFGIGVGMGLLVLGIPIFSGRNSNGSLRHGDNSRNKDLAGSDGGTEPVSDKKARKTPGKRGTISKTPPYMGQPSLDALLIADPRPNIDNHLPLIEECLELRLVGGNIRSRRVAQGEPDEVRMALPPEEILESYRQALRKNTDHGGPPDRDAGRIATSLQNILLQAVPQSVRRRLAATGPREARQLAAIELRLLDSQLERYPWELIADPAALQARTGGVTVWRRILSHPPPVYRRWTGNLLLTGTPSPIKLTPAIDDELAWIKSELNGYGNVHIWHSTGIPSNFRQLMAEHPPAAFHLVAHETSPSALSETGASLNVLLNLVASEQSQAGAWLAVLNCRDSATVPSIGSRPPAYKVAELSGGSAIGMAGPVHCYPGGLFAAALYRCLATGSPAVHAFSEAVCRIRNYGPYSIMWSIPVIYARTSNVVPFPVDDKARIRLGYVQIRLHVEALDRELQGLIHGSFQNSGEWADRTATPAVRTDCIKKYLSATTGCEGDKGDLRRERVNQAQHELEAALSATRASLDRLGHTALSTAERRQVLQELPVHCSLQQSILRKLDELIEEVG
jgi:hypothetical protein